MCSSSISWTRGLVSPFVFLSCKGAAVTERSDIDDESGPLFGIGQPPRWRLASHHVLGMATVSPTHRYRGVHTSSAEVRVASKGRHRMDADDDRSALMNPSPAPAVSLFSDSSSFPFWFCFVLFCFCRFVVSWNRSARPPRDGAVASRSKSMARPGGAHTKRPSRRLFSATPALDIETRSRTGRKTLTRRPLPMTTITKYFLSLSLSLSLVLRIFFVFFFHIDPQRVEILWRDPTFPAVRHRRGGINGSRCTTRRLAFGSSSNSNSSSSSSGRDRIGTKEKTEAVRINAPATTRHARVRR